MTTVIPRKVQRNKAFTDWLEKLTDDVAKAAIAERIDRLRKGNMGDVHPVKDASGLAELRVNHGPGYRVYFITVGTTIILLLCAGDKSTQTRDIKRAKNMIEEIVVQHAAAKKKREEDERKAAKAAVKAGKSTTSKRK